MPYYADAHQRNIALKRTSTQQLLQKIARLTRRTLFRRLVHPHIADARKYYACLETTGKEGNSMSASRIELIQHTYRTQSRLCWRHDSNNLLKEESSTLLKDSVNDDWHGSPPRQHASHVCDDSKLIITIVHGCPERKFKFLSPHTKRIVRDPQ